jgi:4-hydroxy-tetrahydrodipicolinate reductase
MKIALLGYGKMGKVIEKIALERNHEIVARINTAAEMADLNNADIAIDFSTPSAASGNIYKCFESNIPVVVGTTGWYDQFPAIEADAMDKGKSLFYATNFSIGVNIFFELNRKLAETMNRFPAYDAEIVEIHHKEKLDAPSGTAITLGEAMIDELDRKNSWIKGEAFKEEELSIVSLREPDVPGTHEIKYSSSVDEISIKHEAKNRMGFATGAVLAAEWLLGKTGVFTMRDLLKT